MTKISDRKTKLCLKKLLIFAPRIAISQCKPKTRRKRQRPPVKIEFATPQGPPLVGKLTFIESTVDSASGTIAMKAAFSNAQKLLWPGTFVNVSLSPRVLPGALTVPVQAVQSGPERKFVFVVDAGNKASSQPVEVELTQAGIAAVKGVAAGARVVVEGAQNVRNNNIVTEGAADKNQAKAAAGKNPLAGDTPAGKP